MRAWWWLFLAACGGVSDEKDATETDETDPPTLADGPTATTCDGTGQPCLVAAMTPAMKARLEALSDAAWDALAAGTPAEDVAAGLRAEPDVVGAVSGGHSVRFRVQGSVVAWVLGPAATRDGGPVAGIAPANLTSPVVGGGEDEKVVRVLEPYAYEFAPYDDLSVVAPRFSDTPDYEGGVQTYENTSAEQQVEPAAFSDWAGLEVVHLSTHGDMICDDEEAGVGCETLILAGRLQDGVSLHTPEDGGEPFVTIERGVRVGGFTGANFARKYPDLSDTALFFSACRSFRASDLADAVREAGGQYFGWTDYVQSSYAQRAAARFYTETLTYGRRSGDAYQALVADGLHVNDHVDEKGIRRTAVLRGTHELAGEGLRLRDVVRVTDRKGAIRKDDVTLAVLTEQGDGEPDIVRLNVKVWGAEPDEVAVWKVRFQWDGVDVDGELTLARDATPSGEYQWLLKGEVELPFDTDPYAPYTLRAIVDLPEGGTSEHELTAYVGTPELHLAIDFQMVGQGVNAHQIAEGQAGLEYDDATGTWGGDGSIDWVQYEPYLSTLPQGCSIVSNPVGGEIQVPALTLPGEDWQVGVAPEGLDFFFSALFGDNTLRCGGVRVPADDYLMVGTFLANRSDDGTYQEAEGVFRVDDLEAGEGEIVGRKVWERTRIEGDGAATITERTELWIEVPSLRPR